MSIKNHLEPFTELFLSNNSMSFRLMRFFGRFPKIRRKGFDHNYRVKLQECGLSEKSEIISQFDYKEVLSKIEHDGFYPDIKVSNSFLNYLLEIVSNNKFVDRRTGFGEFKINVDNLVNPGNGYIYSLINPHDFNDRLNRFTSDEVKPIADAYLGANSKILNSQIWVTFPDNNNTYNPDFGFHYDLDDYRFLKLFIYLSDVDENSGPHQIIEKSHKGNSLFRFFNRRLKNELPERYKNNVRIMLGKKGEGFFEDTFCYHKGSRPNKPRIILQLQFSLNEVRL